MVVVVNVGEMMVETNRMLADDGTSDGIAHWTCWAYRTRCSLDGRQWPTSLFRCLIRRRRRCCCMHMRMMKKVMVVVIFLLAATADAGLGRVSAAGQLQQSRRGLLDVAVEAHGSVDYAFSGWHRLAFSCSHCCNSDRSNFRCETFRFLFVVEATQIKRKPKHVYFFFEKFNTMIKVTSISNNNGGYYTIEFLRLFQSNAKELTEHL
jgi:hypothetical protein